MRSVVCSLVLLSLAACSGSSESASPDLSCSGAFEPDSCCPFQCIQDYCCDIMHCGGPISPDQPCDPATACSYQSPFSGSAFCGSDRKWSCSGPESYCCPGRRPAQGGFCGHVLVPCHYDVVGGFLDPSSGAVVCVCGDAWTCTPPDGGSRD